MFDGTVAIRNGDQSLERVLTAMDVPEMPAFQQYQDFGGPCRLSTLLTYKSERTFTDREGAASNPQGAEA